MSDDRELIELAAKAAGLVGEWGEDMPGVCDCSDMFFVDEYPWCPLEDDAHAFRLAVDMRLEIDIHHTGIAVRTPDGHKVLVNAEDVPNAHAATRRAIVRAAAEIGRAGK